MKKEFVGYDIIVKATLSVAFSRKHMRKTAMGSQVLYLRRA